MSTLTARPAAHTRPRRLPAGIVTLAAAIAAVAAAEAVAAIGKALGAAHTQQLTPGAIGFMTVLGVVAGAIVWQVIIRRADTPARVLQRLVPATLLLSLLPDLALGAGGSPWSAVVTLMVAHVAVFAVAVPILARGLGTNRRAA